MTAVVWLLGLLTMFQAVASQDAPDFETEVLPVVTRAGCNSGACHGAAAGRGGFHLSLFGADPGRDYAAITVDREGRRVNLVRPELSLLLRKPAGELNHGGGVILEDGGREWKVLADWIRTGRQRGHSQRLMSLTVGPERLVFETVPAVVEFEASAAFDGESPEDVTQRTLFTSLDHASVRIANGNQATVLRPGQHVVVARFLSRVVPIRITVPFGKTVPEFSASDAGVIDQEIVRILQELRIPASPGVSDDVWLRRASLDLTGRLPDPAVALAFLQDSSPERFERETDRLLESEGFADIWGLRFAKLLRIHSLPNEPESLQAYTSWLRDAIASGTGLNEIALSLLTATGDSHTNGPANFGRMVQDARQHAELVGEVFVGAKLGCANCHNHPLDRWTQDDYHGLAAVFARLERGRMVQLNARGSVTNLRTGEPATPRIPGERDLAADEDHRRAVYDWVISDKHNSFARVTVNRLWRSLFGRGLVEPVDDLRDTNPATHPALLDQLAEEFAASGYQLRPVLKLMVLSDAYRRSPETVPGNEGDDRFLSRALRRSMEPEVLLDAIADVTGVPERSAAGVAFRAVDARDPVRTLPVLDLLGRCVRQDECNSASSAETGLPAYLHLMNGDVVNRRLQHPDGRLKRLIAAGETDAGIVREFSLRAFCQYPSAAELSGWEQQLASGPAEERQQRLEDFVWSLLSSRRFRELQGELRR